MAWMFPIFFGVLLIAGVIYLVMEIRERMKPVQQVECALETRMREKFPNQTVLGRRDKVDYHLTFRTETGEHITIDVSKAVYRRIPKEVPGTLCHRGSKFISFTHEGTVIRNS